MRRSSIQAGAKFILAGAICAAFSPLLPIAEAGPGGGYSSSLSGIAQREVIRRQERIKDAQDAEAEGDAASVDRDYDIAITGYQRALDLLPNAPATASQRDGVVSKFSENSILRANELANMGERDAARAMLTSVLSFDPNNGAAKTLLRDLDDPQKYSQAMTPEHGRNVKAVEGLLELGVGYYDLGQFDRAKEQFNKVLAIDRYNTAARRLLERTERSISRSYESARDHQRAHMLRMVDEQWAVPVPNVAVLPTDDGGDIGGGAGETFLIEKLKRIVLPQLQFEDATIEEAITFLRIKSRELDVLESDPGRRGVNFILKTKSDDTTPRVTLSLVNVPLGVALKAITDLAGLRYRVEPFAVLIVPLTDDGLELYTRVFKVRPDFLSQGGGADDGGGDDADPFAADDGGGSTSSLATRANARQILESAGVTFSDNASAFFNPATSQLIVRNTATNIDLIQTFIEQNQETVQKQIFITTKFIEISQRNIDELGFDWLLGQFNIPTSNRVFGGGGTAGNQGIVNAADFPFIPPSLGGAVPVGASPITSGNRSGSSAITSDAIDGLIARESAVSSGGASSVAPGIFGLSGVFTDPQFQVVIRALAQKKGTDLMSAPSVVTRSGQRARIEVIREFIYPIEFDPPEIPQEFGTGTTIGGGGAVPGIPGLGGGGGGGSVSSFPVTPTTPTSFETRNVGVTLEVDPVVGNDGFTIDLNLAPEVVEFEGFVNYGSPIQTGAVDALGRPTQVVLTENKIEQPVFSTRRVSTAVTIWDGQTVGIGGLIREDVQTVEDKVPFLGDLPLFGRLFRSKAEEHFKRNLMIFVTATLIDPAGIPIRNPGGGGGTSVGAGVGGSDLGGGPDTGLVPSD